MNYRIFRLSPVEHSARIVDKLEHSRFTDGKNADLPLLLTKSHHTLVRYAVES